MEVSRLGVKLELQLQAYTTATATSDLSCVCNPHHSSRQRQILSPLSKVRDRTHNVMVPSQIHFHCATTGTPFFFFVFVFCGFFFFFFLFLFFVVFFFFFFGCCCYLERQCLLTQDATFSKKERTSESGRLEE